MEGGFRWQGLVGERGNDLLTRFEEEAVAEEGVQEQERMWTLPRRHVGVSSEEG